MATLSCVGCGEDITRRAADRRSLAGGGDAERVKSALIDVLECLTDADDANDVENFLQRDLCKEKMCRKCFSDYNRYEILHTVLHELIVSI